MKRVQKIIFLILSITLIISASVFADIGNTNRYQTDTGGTNYSNDYSYSNSSTGDAFLIYLLIDMIGEKNFFWVIVILLIYGYYRSRKAKNIIVQSTNITNVNRTNTNVMNEFEIERKILDVDPNFSKAELLSFVKEVFIDIQTAWTNKDLEKIRTLETNELFNQHTKQLQEYIDAGKTNIVEKITIPSVKLYNFIVDDQYETLQVDLNAIMRDYVIDDNTKKVLESDPDKDWNMNYILTFIRTSGTKTEASNEQGTKVSCPNCGAPTMITNYGKCEYCGSVIESNKFGWVLNDIRSK